MVSTSNVRSTPASSSGFSFSLERLLARRIAASAAAAGFALSAAFVGAACAGQLNAPSAGAQIDLGKTAHADAAPGGDLLGAGWLKTFPYAEDGAALNISGARLFLPEVHETVLEAEVRAALLAELAKQGYSISAREDEADFTLTYSAEVQNEFKKTPPQSPIRFAPSLSDPQRDDRFGRNVPASIAFDPHTVYYDKDVGKLGERSVSLTVYLNKGDERVWAGFAAARMGTAGRSALAKVMAEEIVASLGGVRDESAAIFRGELPTASVFEPPLGKTN